MRRTLVAFLVLVSGVGLAACSDAADGTSAPEPLRVLVVGDSIAREVAGGLAAAYEAPGDEASFFLLPAVATPSRTTDTAALLELDPDVVVVLVGTWEGVAVDTSVPGWEQAYLDDVLRPFLTELHDAGVEVVWLGYPVVDEPAEAERHTLLNQVYAGLPERFDDVAYVDAGAAVEAADGSYVASLDLRGLGPTQVRTGDGAHLCPAGVELMAAAVVAQLAEHPGVEPDADWQQAGWRHDPTGFEEPQDCVGAF